MPYSYVELMFNQKGVGFWILYETQPESYLDFPSEKKKDPIQPW